MKKTVVVTGGAGFIGSYLSRELLAKGFNVHIVDSLVAGTKERVTEGAILHTQDVREREALEKLFAEMSPLYCVFHLAALPRVQLSIEEPAETNSVNIGGTVNVLHAASNAGARRLVYSASSSAYGDQEVMPLHEELPTQPKSPYGLQKYVGELYARLWSELYGLPTVSLRYFNVYGPGFDPEGPYALVIGKFLKQRKEGKPLTITGDGTQTRDFTHLSDIARANLLAMESERVGKGEVMNIGAGNNVSINELARLMGGEVAHIDPRIEPKHTKADNRKARELLGWEPKVPFSEGIAALKQEWGIS